MKIGNIYVSKIQWLYNTFVLGIEVNWSNHIHDVYNINRLELNFEFLFWQFDVSIWR